MSTSAVSSRRRSLDNYNAIGSHSGAIMNEVNPLAFLDDYDVGQKIGEGGFAKVKVAIHKLSGEKVAIKIVDKTALKNALDERRLEREVNALKTLRHQYICHLYEYHDVGEKAYFIMEYTPKGELFDYIVARQRLSDIEARKIFRQVVSAVAFCHLNGFVHRDLKPENILLDKDNNVRLIDFGLVAYSENTDKPLLTCCGSPAYAAPELIKGLKYYGPKADMWSLGILLFALLCGYLPFDHENIHVLYSLILSGSFEIPSWVSHDGAALITALLQGDPDRRIPMTNLLRHKWLVRGYETPGQSMSFDSTLTEKVNLQAAKQVSVYYNLSIDEFSDSIEQQNGAQSREQTLYHLLNYKMKCGQPIKLPSNPNLQFLSVHRDGSQGTSSGGLSNLVRSPSGNSAHRLSSGGSGAAGGIPSKGSRLQKQNSHQYGNLSGGMSGAAGPLFAIDENNQIDATTALKTSNSASGGAPHVFSASNNTTPNSIAAGLGSSMADGSNMMMPPSQTTHAIKVSRTHSRNEGKYSPAAAAIVNVASTTGASQPPFAAMTPHQQQQQQQHQQKQSEGYGQGSLVSPSGAHAPPVAAAPTKERRRSAPGTSIFTNFFRMNSGANSKHANGQDSRSVLNEADDSAKMDAEISNYIAGLALNTTNVTRGGPPPMGIVNSPSANQSLNYYAFGNKTSQISTGSNNNNNINNTHMAPAAAPSYKTPSSTVAAGPAAGSTLPQSDKTIAGLSSEDSDKPRRRRLTLDTISSTLKSAFGGKMATGAAMDPSSPAYLHGSGKPTTTAHAAIGAIGGRLHNGAVSGGSSHHGHRKDLPRELTGNYSADTTTTKVPRDVVAELLRVLNHLKISYKLKDTFLIRCHKRDRMGVLYTLKMDMEVVLIPNTHGHIVGVRFHRIKGDPFEYQSLCSNILFESRL